MRATVWRLVEYDTDVHGLLLWELREVEATQQEIEDSISRWFEERAGSA